MTLTKLALITHDLNATKYLDCFEWDINPEVINSDYELVFIYLDSEVNFKKSLTRYTEINELKDKLIGIHLPGEHVFDWVQQYPFINGFLNLVQLKQLGKNQLNSPLHNGIFLKVKNRFEKIHFNQIRWIMAKDVYSIIKTENARYLVGHSLKEMEEKLIPYTNFKRIHRSYLINLDYIEAIEEGQLIMDSEPIPIGPAYKEDLNSRLLFM